MASLDIDAILRWSRFDPQRRLARRPDAALPFLSTEPDAGQGLLLDTCVYIDRLRGRLPGPVIDLLEVRQVNHSTVAVQELMHGIGALDPDDHRTAGTIANIAALIRSLRPHRTFAPDPDLLGRAAVLSGLLSRLQGYSGDTRVRALHDATLFLQAQKLGLVIVTRNIGDFDLLLQLFPRTAVRMYRLAERPASP